MAVDEADDSMELETTAEEAKDADDPMIAAAPPLDDDDDDDDDETNRTTKNPSTTPRSPPPVQNAAVVFTPELLQIYYARLFPFELLHQWMSYGQKSTFRHREFSFTLDKNGEEIYIRYQSFRDQADLAQAIYKRRPVKIDIGAVYSHPPTDKNAAGAKFVPESRELVFDIDLTDYDDVRKCGCAGASICHVCWKYMRMAVDVVDETLRDDFGFTHIAWFYSGRRGVHCWVCDESARGLSDQARGAVANYIGLGLGADKNKESHLSTPLHPMLARAYERLEPLFMETVLPRGGHGLLASEEAWSGLLATLPECANEVRLNLTKVWTASTKSPREKWIELKKHLAAFKKKTVPQPPTNNNNKAAKTLSTKDRELIDLWPIETVFVHTYPKLDVEVSKKRNHLLKSPFCIHPKTGRVCVPIADIESFDPFAVPTLAQIVEELDQAVVDGGDDAETKSNNNRPDWYKTSLRQYFEPLQKDFLDPVQVACRSSNRDAKDKISAVNVEF